MIVIGYLTLLERKIIGGIQNRVGPRKVGWYGLGQPLADGLKLFLKDTVMPGRASVDSFKMAPWWTFGLSLSGLYLLPGVSLIRTGDLKNSSFLDEEQSVLLVLAISSLSIYGIILGGWSSRSVYSILGSIRSGSQMISYEIGLGILITSIILYSGCTNITEMTTFTYMILPLWPICILFFISILAETNRHPFDLPEAESELVAGYYVEYSGINFAWFYIGECGSILLMSMVFSLIFINEFVLNILIVLWFFSFFRATYPRYRYDQLISIGWTILIPLALSLLSFYSFIILIL